MNAPNWLWFLIALLVILAVLWLIGIRVTVSQVPGRRYARTTKAQAIIAAELTSVAAAAQATGIPRRTLDYWLERPEFADLRTKTREVMAEGSFVLAQMAQDSLARKIERDEVEPRDLATIYGIAIDKGQLLSGHATSRQETKDITDTLDDTEREALRNAIDEYLKAADVPEPV